MDTLWYLFGLLGPAALAFVWIMLDINRQQRRRSWATQWALLLGAGRVALRANQNAWLLFFGLAAAWLLIGPLAWSAGPFGTPDAPAIDQLYLAVGLTLAIPIFVIGARAFTKTCRQITDVLGRDTPAKR